MGDALDLLPASFPAVPRGRRVTGLLLPAVCPEGSGGGLRGLLTAGQGTRAGSTSCIRQRWPPAVAWFWAPGTLIFTHLLVCSRCVWGGGGEELGSRRVTDLIDFFGFKARPPPPASPSVSVFCARSQMQAL